MTKTYRACPFCGKNYQVVSSGDGGSGRLRKHAVSSWHIVGTQYKQTKYYCLGSGLKLDEVRAAQEN